MDLVLDTRRPDAAARPSGPGSEGREPGEAPSAELCDFIRKMRAKPAAEFQTEDAAAAFGVTPFGFIRAFKKLTGLSPQRFRAGLRIELAKRLLVETDRPVTEISFDVGYNSLGTFVRTFTLLVGISPGQLRRLAADHLAAGDRLPTPCFRPLIESRAGVIGRIAAPMPADAIVVAGLFSQGIPAGLPADGCFVDPADRRFGLCWPAGRRRVCLLVASIRHLSLADAWAGRMRDAYVCSASLSADARRNGRPLRVEAALRPLRNTDPPFLVPLPLLLAAGANRAPEPALGMQSGRSATRA